MVRDGRKAKHARRGVDASLVHSLILYRIRVGIEESICICIRAGKNSMERTRVQPSAGGTTRTIQGKRGGRRGSVHISACKRRHLGSLRPPCNLQPMLFLPL